MILSRETTTISYDVSCQAAASSAQSYTVSLSCCYSIWAKTIHLIESQATASESVVDSQAAASKPSVDSQVAASESDV